MKLIKYGLYLLNWKLTHYGWKYRGMRPACYAEWLDNEYLEEKER